MKRLTYDEVACVFASILLLVLSFHSRSLGFVRGYEFNTTMVCVAICLVPMILKRCGAFTLPGPFTILILLAVCLHSLGVLYFSYDQFVHYDTLTHSLSSIVVTICVFLVLMCYHVLNDRVRFAGASLAIFVALLMLGFSVYWEFLENVVDVFTGTRMQYSPFDTVRDVICNTVASFVTSMILQLYMNRRTPESMVEELDLHPKLVRFIANRKYRRVSDAFWSTGSLFAAIPFLVLQPVFSGGIPIGTRNLFLISAILVLSTAFLVVIPATARVKVSTERRRRAAFSHGSSRSLWPRSSLAQSSM